MLNDQGKDMSSKVQYLIDNKVGVLAYSGDKDFICNWRGGEAWTNTLKINEETLSNQDYSPWIVDGDEAGEFKTIENFTFLRVYDAGHMVPMDQPKNSLEMFKKFISREF